jgi:hypothetical protein
MKKFTDILNENTELDSLVEFKISDPNVGNNIKNYIYNYLKITKEKLNDPENVKKLNDFLDSAEETTTKVVNAVKKERNLRIISNMVDIGKWISIVAGVYGLIFNTKASFFHGVELGGITALKLAFFLYIIKLIISVFRKYHTFTKLVRDGKKFVDSIVNIIKQKKSNDNITENYIECLKNYEIIE